MTNAIRARIDQIRQGKVPEGYVRTRAGIMPSDWPTTIKARDVFCSHSVKSNGCGLTVLSATQDRGIVPRSEVDIDIKYDTNNLDSYKKVDVGDFVISLRSFQGGIECSAYEGIVSPAYTVLKNKIAICNGYYREYFKTDDFIARLNGAVYGIRDGKQIGFDDFGDMLIHCPSLQEQERIAKILSTCDRIIDKYEEETEQYRKLKQYLLDKMFPIESAAVPEIRFPDFTDAWEQRKFGNDIESIQTGTNLLGAESKNGTPLLKMGNIQRGYFDISKLEYLDESDTVEPENIAYYGDFFFNTRNTMELVGKGATWLGDSEKYAFNSNIARFKFKDIDTVFFNYLYNTEDVTKQVHARATGTTSVAAIYPRALETVEYFVPSREEQAKIGELFVRLDNLITLHQREAEAWKTKKKALDQLLLTGIVRA